MRPPEQDEETGARRRSRPLPLLLQGLGARTRRRLPDRRRIAGVQPVNAPPPPPLYRRQRPAGGFLYLGASSATGGSNATRNSAMLAFQVFPTCSSITSNGAVATSAPSRSEKRVR